MNILVVSQYFWPENFRINELVTEWVRRGHRVTVLTGRPNYPEGKVFSDYQRNPAAYARYGEADVIRVPMLARGRGQLRLVLNYVSFVLGACLWGIWRLRRIEVDVIFVFEPSPVLVGIPSALLRQLKRAPQAFWVLDLWPESLKAVGIVRSERLLGWVAQLVSFVYRHCDLILAQSRSFVDDIARLAPEGRRIEYFPAWADAVFTGALADPAPEVPIAPGVFTILFAGNIGEAQDFPAILDAVERLKERADIRWVIVGDGRVAGWVRNQVEMRGLGHRLLMVGRYPLDRMPAFFAHADALLLSLKDEPVFGLTIPGKLQSYLAAGIPVLAMLNGEGAAIIEAAGAGLVCPAGDGAGLARIALRLAKTDPAERKHIGDRGRHLCIEEFDLLRLVDRLDLWLVELVRAGISGTGER